jgi:hypothetical protein
MNKEKIMNKAMIESYLRNLLGVVLALVVSQMQVQGVASPLELSEAGWLLVLNGVWAAAVPTLIRYLNAKDPAFGRVAEVVAVEVSKKITATAKKAPAKATPAKAPAKKTTPKK